MQMNFDQRCQQWVLSACYNWSTITLVLIVQWMLQQGGFHVLISKQQSLQRTKASECPRCDFIQASGKLCWRIPPNRKSWLRPWIVWTNPQGSSKEQKHHQITVWYYYYQGSNLSMMKVPSTCQLWLLLPNYNSESVFLKNQGPATCPLGFQWAWHSLTQVFWVWIYTKSSWCQVTYGIQSEI